MADKDEELLTRLREESEGSLGAHEGALFDDIKKLNDYYHGRPYGDEMQGRSQFVTREVYETVESLMPYLVRVFFSSDKAAVFEPEDEDDVEAANQETEYVNWVFYRDNPGFKVGYTWLKDGLMNKVGYIKISRESPEPITTTYKNQSPEQMALIAEEIMDNFEGDVEAEQNDDGTFDVSVSEITGRDKTVIQNIPPEEFRISEGDIEPDSARYCSHDAPRTLSEIRGMGFEIDDDVQDSYSLGTSTLRTDRYDDATEMYQNRDDEGPGRIVTLHEEYIRYDDDDDGMEELWQVFRVGDTILLKEKVALTPFAHWSPIIVPHRHHGSTPVAVMTDIQRLKSKVTRNLLDNQEGMVDGMYAVVDGQVNLDDLMSRRSLGVVRETFAGAVRALPTPALDRSAYDVLGLADSWGEKRTGVSERGQGLDPNMFNSNTTATAAELTMSNAEQKQELMARIFGETGFKTAMLKIHKLGLQNEEKDKKIRNNNGEFIALSPDAWRTRYDMTITVGIGNGSKNQQMMQMQMLEQSIQAIVQGGGLGTLVTPTNLWNFAMEKTRVAGRKDASKFFTKPETDQADEGPSVEEQAKMKEMEMKEAELELEKQTAQLKEAEVGIKQREQELKEQELALKERVHEDTNAFKLAELELEREQARSVKLGND